MNVLGNEVKLLPEIKAKAIALIQDNPTRMHRTSLHAGGCYCVLGWICVATQELLGIGKFVPSSPPSDYSHYAFSMNGNQDPVGEDGDCFVTKEIQQKIFTGLPEAFQASESPCLEITRIGDSRALLLEEKIQWIDDNL